MFKRKECGEGEREVEEAVPKLPFLYGNIM